jgi:hypothetical protein
VQIQDELGKFVCFYVNSAQVKEPGLDRVCNLRQRHLRSIQFQQPLMRRFDVSCCRGLGSISC